MPSKDFSFMTEDIRFDIPQKYWEQSSNGISILRESKPKLLQSFRNLSEQSTDLNCKLGPKMSKPELINPIEIQPSFGGEDFSEEFNSGQLCSNENFNLPSKEVTEVELPQPKLLESQTSSLSLDKPQGWQGKNASEEDDIQFLLSSPSESRYSLYSCSASECVAYN